MIVFGGVLALAFYCFLIGAVLPLGRESADRAASGISDYFLGCVAASLWVAWFIAAATILIGAPSFFYVSFGAAFILAGVLFVRTLMHREVFISMVQLPDADTLSRMGIVFGLAAALTTNLVFSDSYHDLFNTWDAIVSWNRWGLEISQGRYDPIDGGYPILFPGLWSLIYRAQGDSSVWFVAKASMFLIPVLATTTVVVLIERARLVEAALTAIFVFTFFFVSRAYFLLEGMMDVPVSALVLCAGVFIYLAIDRLEQDRVEDAVVDLRLAFLFSGLAAITKQPGTLIFAPLLVAAFLVLKRSQFPIREGLGLAIRGFAPVVVFLIIYIQRQPDPFGNFDYLRTLAAQTPSGVSKMSNAYNWIKNMWQPQMLLLIAALPFANLSKLDRPSGVTGLAFLFTAIIGAFIFADCCSYEPRNGWWILPFLVVGSLFGVRNVLSDKFGAALCPPASPLIAIPRNALAFTAFVAALAAATALSAAKPDSRMRSMQVELQWRLLWPDVNALIRANEITIGDSKVVSSYQILGWLPGLDDNYVNCWNDVDCTIAQLSANGGFLLTNTLDSLPRLQEFVGDADLRGEARGWRLYGPILRSQTAVAAESVEGKN